MEAEIKFEREDRNGVVAVGTYLINAAGRLGIEIDDQCGRRGECDSCAITVKQGADFLSKVTKAEIEHLSDKRRKAGERLACQAKIEKSGEVVIMTKAKKAEEKPAHETKTEEFRKEFEKMPLDQKVASLFELEAITLSETVSYVFNAPYEFAGKVMGVMSNFGRKMEDDSKKATRPNEHKPAETEPKAESPKKKSAPKKKPVAKKSAKQKAPKATDKTTD
jgi:ferredoxin